MSTDKDLTVYIGRFSPFHMGHAQTLKRALETSKVVLILIGSAGQARTIKNPFTFDERVGMIISYIKKTFRNTNVRYKIVPISDHPYNDQSWIREVQSAVDDTTNQFADVLGPCPQLFLTGMNKDSSSNYLNKFGNFFHLDFVESTCITDKSSIILSATGIRNILFSDSTLPDHVVRIQPLVPETTYSFIKSFVLGEDFNSLKHEFEFIESYHNKWAVAPYAPTFMTVDAVVIQSGYVLVNVRDNFPGVGLWALPGGFVNSDERLIDACVRELQEETRIALSPAQLYGSIRSKEIFDDPCRSLRGRTITTAYLFKLDDTKKLPSVKPQKGEVRKVEWIPISKALENTDMWFEDHLAILHTLYARL